MPPNDLTARYVALANQLGEKTSHARGWRRRVAEDLGVDESTLSKILNGSRAVGIDLAERATERLRLPSDYFWTDRDEPKSEDRRSSPNKSLEALIRKFDERRADIDDVYALAKHVLEAPSIVQAQKILKKRKPKSEKQIGSLFLEASKLINMVRRE